MLRKFIILLFGITIYFLFVLGTKYIPKEKQIYLKQKYLFHYDFQHSLKLDMTHRDKASFRYLLTHKEELEKAGGFEAQLSLAIYENEHTFMNILFNEYSINVERLIENDPNLIRHLLRENYVEFFKKLILSLDKTKQKEILKKLFKREMDEFLKYSKQKDTFFENVKTFSTFLELSKFPKDDKLLISLLNHASGLFKVELVKALIDYDVIVNRTDENNVTPLVGLFIYTPTADKIKKPNSSSFDADFEEANILLDWYLKKYKSSKHGEKQVFTKEQERVFRLHIGKKREVYRLLIKAGADENRTRVNNKTVFEIFKSYEDLK